MSNSVFADNANALLEFKMATSDYQIDPATNNRIPIVGTIQITVYLKRASLRTTDVPLSGADQTGLLLDGRAVDPQFLPPTLRVGTRGNCTITDLYTGNQETGLFEVTELHQSAFPSVTESLGSYIQGLFRQNDAGEVLYG